MCCPTGCTQWPLLGSHVSNYMSCCSTGLPGPAKGIPVKRKHTVDLPTEKSRHGGSNAKSGCCITNANVRHWSLDIKGFLHAFRGKEEDARVEVDAYMEYCAKRWQTREGTYQLKRRRLLPDVRDPPEQEDAEVDMTDI